ncbi:hypothetical protein EZV62_005518 [Acer yangbiense]|uniref:F-box domain-containing protein n=1 Tax=Acer yangbiense TaxID=1000413 RepID=A0A5C7IMK3_9ROSI|nr:hypothetical protein EZV62_005518 [Acer yangbiense]
MLGSTKRTKTSSNISITISTSSNHQSAAETVANIDDLLTDILLHLPIKSLLKFKSVSKHWLSLITNPNFSLRRTLVPEPISGLFVHGINTSDFDYINLTTTKPCRPPFKSLTFLDSKASILQSCNGLLLCTSCRPGRRNERNRNYCVYNPTTKQYTVLPPLPVSNGVFRAIHGVNLAYDPSKSPDYKVICVRNCDSLQEGHYQIEIYSSKTGPWRKSGGTFIAAAGINFSLGVFWNCAIHWISYWGNNNSLYFDADEEKLHELSMPAVPDGYGERMVRYFGESRNHLHLIEIYGPCTALFNVYEMERDYSGWFVKYRVDLLSVAAAFPEMIRSNLDPWNLHYYGFWILSIIREDKDENSYLVVHLTKKAIRYNFNDKSFLKLHDFAPVGSQLESESTLEFEFFDAFHYIESLGYV